MQVLFTIEHTVDFTISRNIMTHFEQQFVSKQLEHGQQKAGNVKNSTKKHLEEHLKLIRLSMISDTNGYEMSI